MQMSQGKGNIYIKIKFNLLHSKAKEENTNYKITRSGVLLFKEHTGKLFIVKMVIYSQFLQLFMWKPELNNNVQ